ncbi:MAG: glycosyltransferase [Candidatus Pacebacteria bacterium]|nr:glycosyltransferase [Candidatus Paceibacterota bacterium]
MKIFYSLEVFFPHISGVTITTDRLAKHFSQKKNKNQVWIITSSENGKFQIINNKGSYNIIKIKSYRNPIKKKLKVSYFAPLKLRKILKDFKPDLIHIQDPLFISNILAIEAKKMDIPVIATQHSSLDFPLACLEMPDFFKKMTAKAMAAALSKFFNNYCRVLIVPSNYIKSEAVKWGVNIPIEVVSNGIDLDLYAKKPIPLSFIEEYHLEDFVSKPIVFYCGRLDKDKNLNVLIKAIPSVVKETDANFLFLGTGEKEEEIKEKIKVYSCQDKVRFIGKILPSNEKISYFYHLSSVFVMPSAIEGQSLVTMEAMASGLPIVAADSGALPELVKDGENGYLVDPFNPESFSQAIIKILKDKKLSEIMGQKSRSMILKHNYQETYALLEKVYEKAIN